MRHTLRRISRATVAVVVGAAGTFAAMSVVATAPAGAATNCASLNVLVARGTGEPGQFGIIVGDGVVGQTLARVPGAIATNIDYPASLDPNSPNIGVQKLVATVTERAAACPNEKFALVGYSQGASVVNGALGQNVAGLLVSPGTNNPVVPAALAPRIASVALFGSPGRTVGKSVPAQYTSRTLDQCNFLDNICDTTFGSNFFPHLFYGFNGATNNAAGFISARR